MAHSASRSDRPASGDVQAADLQALAVPKYKQLQVLLEHRIRDGVYAPGMQLPTEKELMQTLDYSYTTVNRALQALVRSGLVRRKRGHGTFVQGAVSGEAAESGAVGRTVALFHAGIPEAFHPYYSLLREGFIAGADRHGVAMKFILAKHGELGVHERFRERHGIVGFAASQARASDLREALALRIPAVLLSESYPDLALDRVHTDHREGMRLAFDRLRSLGHRRFAFCGTFDRGSVRDTLAELFDCVPEQVPLWEYYAGGWQPEHARGAVAWLRELNPRPTALFVSDEFLLARIWEELDRGGIRVPKDLALIGRGSPVSAAFMGRPATLVEYDPRALGQAAVDLLLAPRPGGFRAPRTIRIPPTLAVRASIG